MKVAQLYLSDFELDRIELLLTGESDSINVLTDVLNELGIDMDATRVVEALAYDDFGVCVACGDWGVISGSCLCNPCYHD